MVGDLIELGENGVINSSRSAPNVYYPFVVSMCSGCFEHRMTQRTLLKKCISKSRCNRGVVTTSGQVSPWHATNWCAWKIWVGLVDIPPNYTSIRLKMNSWASMKIRKFWWVFDMSCYIIFYLSHLKLLHGCIKYRCVFLIFLYEVIPVYPTSVICLVPQINWRITQSGSRGICRRY